MDQAKATRALIPSLIDRLGRAGRGETAPAGIEEVRASVIHDLEQLLNSRRVPLVLSPPLDDSLLAYGLPDLSSARLDEADAREQLRVAIAGAIRRFEPRLADVRVEVDAVTRSDLRLRFRIEAMLRVDPEPQPFCVEPMLDLPSRAFVLPTGRDDA